MDGVAEAYRLAAMVGGGCVLLAGLVWRDQARFDDGWLIVLGYALAISGGVGVWSEWWFAWTIVIGFFYVWRRNWLRARRP